MTAPGVPPRIVLATRPVDFRKQIDALAGVVENELGLDPYSGVAVVFRCEEQRDQIKVLPSGRNDLYPGVPAAATIAPSSDVPATIRAFANTGQALKAATRISI